MATKLRAQSDDSRTESNSSGNEASNALAKGDHASTESVRSSLQDSMALTRFHDPQSQFANMQPHQHTTLFHLSLIEGRCRTQAASILNARRRFDEQLPENHPEVHSLAQHLFKEMTTELHRAGVLPDEFAGQELGELRRNYLSSFDTIIQSIAAKKTQQFGNESTYSSLFDRSHAITIDNELLSASATNAKPFALQKFNMAPGMMTRLRSMSTQDAPYRSQYRQECLLGTGGFGKVYKAFHTLDGRAYAIKKVVMRVDGDLNPEMKAQQMLAEIRALSRLDHRNIVRYHHCWTEKLPASLPEDSSSGSESAEETDGAMVKLGNIKHLNAGPSGAEKNITKRLAKESRHLRQLSRMDGETQQSVVFAGSEGLRGEALRKKKSFFQSPGSPNDSNSDGSLEESKTLDNEEKLDAAYGTDNGYNTEEIQRGTETIHSAAVFDVVLFIQMSLHSMNLEDFLWPEQQKPNESMIEHCYHCLPTARILLAILDGVEYIHRHMIVHRDLKPSNIMLSISRDATSLLDGSIMVSDCPNCYDKESNELYILPHIGDFGLVAEIQDSEVSDPLLALAATRSLTDRVTLRAPPIPTAPRSSRSGSAAKLSPKYAKALAPVHSFGPGLSSRQPGTRFYVAPKSSIGDKIICPKFDVYSLGVIALEMVYKFNTRSERAVELDKLKDGILPHGFEQHSMADGIKSMLHNERTQRWGCSEVRKWLNDIIHGEMELITTK